MATPRSKDGSGLMVDRSDQARAMVPAQSRALSIWDGWFGPLAPLTPVAPAQEVEGRQFDFPFGVNLTYGRPKLEQSETGLGFPYLRQVAEPALGGSDLLRLAIETVKDKLCGMEWTVQAKDGSDGGTAATSVMDLLTTPDGEHGFNVWLRMLLEDHLVLDAVAIFPSVRAGRPVLELVDGATIKRLIDEKGRTPQPPLPAYQQILKGMPAIDYTTKQLCYFAFNMRTNRIYGMSRVEQVVNYIGQSLRRFLHVNEFYTAGTMTDMVIGVPETWTPKQISEFQLFFDATLEGNTAERRKVRFIPGGTTPLQIKGEILKDDFDEWLARVISYAFNLSPQALVKEMNRATAETAERQAAQDGLEPMKLAVKAVLDFLIQSPIVLNQPGLTFVWDDEEITDPAIKATVTTTLTGGKPILTQNEGRALWGYDELTPEELEAMTPAPPPSPFGFGGGDEEDDEAGEEERRLADELDKVRKVRRARRRSLHGAPRPRTG